MNPKDTILTHPMSPLKTIFDSKENLVLSMRIIDPTANNRIGALSALYIACHCSNSTVSCSRGHERVNNIHVEAYSTSPVSYFDAKQTQGPSPPRIRM